MPWQYPDNVPRPSKNWEAEEQKKCTAAANAVLREGGWEDASDEKRKELEKNAIFACIRAAGKSKKKDKSGATLKGFLESRIHQSFTVASDRLYGLGVLTQEERISISSVIGDSLEVFSSKFDELVGDKSIPPDIMEQMVEQGWMDKMKEISAEEILELAEQNPELSDFQLVEKALGEGQGIGGPKQGVGGADICICPKCDYEIEHKRGTPYAEMKCPKCGAALTGKGEKAVGQGRGVGGERQGEGEGEGAPRVCVCPECGEKVDHERDVPCAEVKCPKCGTVMEGWEAAETEEELKFHTIVSEDGQVSLVLGEKSWELGKK